MLTHLTVHLNNAAQDRKPPDHAVCWFTALPAAQQHEALQHLAMFIQQAGAPRRRDIAKVGQALRCHSGGVALTANNVHLALRTLIDTDTSPDTFTLMLAMFAAQDRKRRDTRCAAGCGHWWHHLHQHPTMAGNAIDGHQATVHESRHDRRALVYHGTWPGTGQWLVRVEIPSLHDRPQAGTWFGGRTLYTHAQPSQAEAVTLAQQWLDDGVYPSGPEDHLAHHEPQFRTDQQGVYIGACERCHACGYDCPHDRCDLYEAVPVVHTQRGGLLICRSHLDDDVPWISAPARS